METPAWHHLLTCDVAIFNILLKELNEMLLKHLRLKKKNHAFIKREKQEEVTPYYNSFGQGFIFKRTYNIHFTHHIVILWF